MIKPFKNYFTASVLVVNYNKKKYIKRCLNSLVYQTKKNFDVIFYDDNSTDTSILEAKKFIKKLNIRIVKNISNNKTGITAFDQINSYIQASKFAKGKIIFFLDSDDFFKKNKIEYLCDFFMKNPKQKILFDLPYFWFSKKKNINIKFPKRKFNLSIWPKFPPQSCISIRNHHFKKIKKSLLLNKFGKISLDFRIAIYSFFIDSDFKIIDKYLTYYFQDNFGESSKFSFFSKNWWKRRYEAHNFLRLFLKKNKIKYFYSVDYFITFFVCLFLTFMGQIQKILVQRN